MLPDQFLLVLITKMRKFLISLIIILGSKCLIAQNEANIWYFNNFCGLDFSAGTPEVLYDGPTRYGSSTATISDSIGNYLFCYEWGFIYTSNGIIENGTDMPNPGVSGSAIVEWPGHPGLYFLIVSEWSAVSYNGEFQYSIIDMNLNNGLGAVTEKNIVVLAGWDALDMVAISKMENSEAVWVIVRKQEESSFATFRVDESGFNPDPVLSVMPDNSQWGEIGGHIKISPDKKIIILGYGEGFS